MTEDIREKAGSFSCPSCGGRPTWNPARQNLHCPYCGSDIPVDMDRTAPAEYDIHTAPVGRALDWGEETHVVRCEGCGAQTILGKGESATRCAFCGSPHVLEDQSAAGIAPESAIPFAVPQESAVSIFRKWLKGKLFAPAKAKKMAALGQILGVYLPHWTYDSDTVSQYTGREGHYYYVTVPVRVNRNGKWVTEMRQERRIRWSPTSGVVSQVFDDVLIAGSERLPENQLASVRPYDLGQLCRYQAAFLSGFSAEKASVDVQTGWTRAQAAIDRTMRDLAMRDILRHADEAQVTGIQSVHSNVRYKLTLLPMYLSSFGYKNKTYRVLVNGQSGKCSGQSPVSALRVMIAVLLGLAVVFGLYWLFTGGGTASAGTTTYVYY